jgi:hypothetical protein
LPKIREKSRQNSPKPRQNDGKTAAKHRRRASFNVSRGGPNWWQAVTDSIRRGGGASSARRGLSGAICPAGRGAAALSYIAMYGAAGRDLLPARASSARRGVRIGGIIGPARGGPVLYSYVGRGRGWYGAGGAAVWCRCEVWPVWAAVWGCCPLLYSYVGRGGVRSPTGAGIIGPARPVRGDLSSGAGCCCPLLYSYVGRGGARSPTGAGIIGPARGGGGARPVQCPAAAGGASSARRGIIEPPTENAPEKSPHGKRATKKR